MLPDWLITVPIAHRGLHDAENQIAENSISAFQRAIEHGFAIELDIRFSADQVPMVFHDAELSRMTGHDSPVEKMKANELAHLKLKNSHDYVPTFEQVLALVDGQVPLIIELKPVALPREQAVALIWEMLKSYEGRYTVQSFDPLLLKAFRQLAPHVIRGQLGMYSPPAALSRYRKFMLRHMLLNRFSKPHYIGYDIKDIEKSNVQKLVKHNMALLVWTVTTEADLKKARQYAQNIIFEALPPAAVK